MAYKFQIGPAVLSGSLTQKGNVLAEASVLSGSSLSLAGVAVTATAAELNILNGVTAEASELNILDGVTATTAELNFLSGAAAGTVENSKAVIYSGAGAVVATSVSASGGVSGSVVVAASVLNGPSFTDDGVAPEFSAEVNLNAGFQISGTTVSASAADLNLLTNITSAVYDAGSDLIVFSDNSDSGNLKFESGADFVSAIAGAGIDQVSGQLAISDGNITNAMLLGSIANAKLENSTISGVSLGNNLFSLTNGNGISSITYNGSTAKTIQVQLATTGALEVGVSGLDLKSTIAGNKTFSGNVTVNGNLTVTGSTTYIDTQNLLVTDAQVVFADNALALADNQGWYIGADTSGTPLASFAVQTATFNKFVSSLPISASAFYGDGSNLTGVSADGLQFQIGAPVDAAATATAGVTLVDTAASGAFTLSLPAVTSGNSGKMFVIKNSAQNCGSAACTIAPNGTQKIEGVNQSILLESNGAAVTLLAVYAGGADDGSIII